MTAHDHRTRVPGCYRCELNEDEQGIRPMTAAEVLAAIEEQASRFSSMGYPHDGDCAGSLCTSCGHCLHSIVADCTCPDCGCADAVDDDEVSIKRNTLRAVAALQAVLDLLDERDEETAEVYGESEVATSSLVTTHEVRDALNAALGVQP